MKTIIVSLAFVVACSSSVETITGAQEPTDVVDACSNGQPDEGEMGIDCGGSCQGCGDGAPCATDSDCLSNFCAPQKGTEYGVCYGPAMVGCFVATVPSDIVVLCSSANSKVMLCGDSGYDVTKCVNAGNGSRDETYLCCEVSP